MLCLALLVLVHVVEIVELCDNRKYKDANEIYYKVSFSQSSVSSSSYHFVRITLLVSVSFSILYSNQSDVNHRYRENA